MHHLVEVDDERHARRVLLGFRLGLYTVLGLIAAAVLLHARAGAPEAVAEPSRNALLEGRTGQDKRIELLLDRHGRPRSFVFSVRERCARGKDRRLRWRGVDGRESYFEFARWRLRASRSWTDGRDVATYVLDATVSADGRSAGGTITTRSNYDDEGCSSGIVRFTVHR